MLVNYKDKKNCPMTCGQCSSGDDNNINDHAHNYKNDGNMNGNRDDDYTHNCKDDDYTMYDDFTFINGQYDDNNINNGYYVSTDDDINIFYLDDQTFKNGVHV